MALVPCLRSAVGLAAAAALLASTPAEADVHCVKNGGGDGCFATIGAALAAAADGDLIRVAEGMYIENLLIDANVILEGGWDEAFTARDPASFVTTVFPATESESVVSIQGSMLDPASSTPTFDGFTVTGGGADSGSNHGGGLRLRDTNATLRGNVVTGNRAFLFGGGIWVQRGAPRLEGNRVESNFVTGSNAIGAGVSLEGTQALLVDNLVAQNVFDETDGLGAGIGIAGGGPVVIRGGRIEGNNTAFYGGGVYASNASALAIDGVRFAGSVTYDTGHGDALFVEETPTTLTNSSFSFELGGSMDAIAVFANSPTTIANCTLRGSAGTTAIATGSNLALVNTIVTGWGIGVDAGPAVSVTTTTNDFFANTMDTAGFSLDPGNLAVDPLLDASHHLLAGSPLIDAGSRTAGPFHDFDGEPRPMAVLAERFRFDIGADEFSGSAQRIVDLGVDAADLTILGPGYPPENADSVGNNDWIGYAVLAADVSGDGAADLVFSAEDFAEDFVDLNATGRLFGLLHFGSRVTGTIALASEAPDFQVVSRLEYQHVGETLAAGDFDGDGVSDLVVGSSQNDMDPDPVPTVFGLSGGPSLAASGATLEAGALGDLAVLAPEQGQLLYATENGLALGDLDGDGVDDLAVGDALADDGGLADAGAVFVLFGGPGLAGLRDLASVAPDFTLFGPKADDLSFGVGPYLGGLALGDLDDDGQTDLVARDAESAHVLFGPLAPGARHLASEPADLAITGMGPGSVLVMDATGDGIDDLLLDSDGDVSVVAGPLSSGQSLDLEAILAYALLGADPRALAAGDLIGDERPELLLGDPGQRRVRVVPPGDYGPGALDVDEVAAWVVTGPFQVARNLGFDVAAGDLDGDGRADLVAGAWQFVDASNPDMETNDVGKVVVLYGDAPLPPCGAAPRSGCIAAPKGRLRVDERKAGKEKLSLSLLKLAQATGPAELGDPVAGTTRYDVCLYDGNGAFAAALAVDRAGESCGAKPCWKASGAAGFKYADRAAAASGVTKLLARSGAAGKGKLSLKAHNDAGRGQASLPTGLAAALAGGAGATAQVVASDGACFELAATRVKTAEATRFDASAP